MVKRELNNLGRVSGNNHTTVINDVYTIEKESASQEWIIESKFILQEINQNLLLILKQLELITGEENYG
jgi:hypothetical protein